MQKRNPEVRLLIKILAIVGFVILFLLLAGFVLIKIRAPQLLEFSKGIAEIKITVNPDSLTGARFITGMNGCENIFLEEHSRGAYVSCLDGRINYLAQDSTGILGIRKSFKAGNAVTGLAMDKEGNLIAAVCNNSLKEWRTKGCSLFRISRDLVTMEKISGDFPAMNGICADSSGNLYFASSNFNVLSPEGAIYRMISDDDGSFRSPEPLIQDAGMANGLYYDHFQDKIFFSNTLGGVYEFSPKEYVLKDVYLKLRFMEACDDLCTDISGNVWMTDPGYSTIKMFNPGTSRLARFVIEGIGQTSSCRIRSENGREMLYITELKKNHQPMSGNFDGRGVLIIPAQSLLKLLEPMLIKK
jgi:sugar lactone lactonase YvrE